MWSIRPLRSLAAWSVCKAGEQQLHGGVRNDAVAASDLLGSTAAMPGGAECLIHWRATLETAALQGFIPAFVAADLDMKNFFNTVEWDSIRESAAVHLREALPVLEWEQQKEGVSFLGDQSAFSFNRGSEQGETLGPIKAVLPLVDVRK